MRIFLVLFALVRFSHQRQQSVECKNPIQHGHQLPTESCVINHVYDLRGVYEMLENVKPENVTGLIFKNSSLMAVPRKLFAKFINLRKFDANNVDFRLLARDDFADAHKLTELLLSGNLIQELPNGIFVALKKLQRLDLSRNFISTINEGTFAGSSEDLNFLDLSENKIQELDFTALVPLAHMKRTPMIVKLNRNSIRSVTESHRVHHLMFDQLHLDGNFLKSFSCPDVRVKELHLNNNQLQTISFDNCSVEYLVVSSNQLSWLHVHSDLKGLIASKNQIKSFVINGDSEMYHLELTQNGNIENIFTSLKSMSEMQYLNLSNSVIGVLHEDTFASMSELKYLFLHNAGIQIIPFGIFDNNEKLITLDLSFNDLQTVDLHMFSGLNNLKTLDLSGNDLRQIENVERIRTVLPEIQHLVISGNNWKCLYLSALIRALNAQGISVDSYENNFIETKTDQNISGIACH